MNSDLTFLTNESTRKLSNRLNHLLAKSKRFDCLVGYFYLSGETQLAAEIEYEREVRKKDAETPKIARFRKTRDALEKRLAHLQRVRYDLRNLWQNRPNDDSDDLTDIAGENYAPFKTKPFFLWETQFLEIFFDSDGKPLENPGFDIVIANPPYGAEFSDDEKNLLTVRYDHIVERIRNSFLYFMGLAFSITREKGVITYIIPNEFLFQIYMTKARNFFLENARYLYAVNVGEDVFDAIVPASIVSFQRSKETDYSIPVLDLRNSRLEDLEEKLNIKNFLISSSSLIRSTANNIFTFDVKKTKFVNRIREISMPFEDFCLDIANGISTSHDKVYIVSKDETEQNHFESEYLKPCLRGGQIRRYFCPDETDDFVLYVTKDFEPKKGKNILEYLKTHKKDLIKKSVEKKNGLREWHILFRPRYEELFDAPKIMFRQTADGVVAAFDEQTGFYCIDSINVAKIKTEYLEEIKFLLGVINSAIVNFYYREISQEYGRVLAQVKPQRLRTLPIPDAEDWQKEIIERFVDYILFLTKENPPANAGGSDRGGEKLIINYFESIINALVYELFLPDELHAADKHFFEPLRKENLPALSELAGREPAAIREVFAHLSDINHIVRKNIYFLDNIESVRIIEGKQ